MIESSRAPEIGGGPEGNRFDDFWPDVSSLLADQDARYPLHDPAMRSGTGLSPFWRLGAIARLYGGGALSRLDLHRRLVHANLALGWFDEFRDYWVNELGNRSIDPHEFHVLHDIYRRRANEAWSRPAPPVGAALVRRQGWQDPLAIYQVFHHQYRLALNPFGVRRYARYLRRGGDVCEYGCGLAPITTGIIRFYRHLNVRITCADLPGMMFHFVRWKFRTYPFVRTLAIKPDAPPAFADRFDVIFCLQVFKYVPNPVVVVRQLDEAMRPGGHLIFDYVRGSAAEPGARVEALRYVSERFDVVEGTIPLDGRDVREVVARKKA
jgi:2-polyprenyl-3-methyl-5-hydroxy-6-metoxy-1,4-benzoquinol methylase